MQRNFYAKKIVSYKIYYTKKYFFWIFGIPYTTGMLIPVILLRWSILTDDYTIGVFFLISSLFILHCAAYDLKKWLYKKFGKMYNGKIVEAERMFGRGESTYYFFIEFYKNKRKLIRRTSGYMGNPHIYLENEECHIYEFMGKFIETDFNVSK